MMAGTTMRKYISAIVIHENSFIEWKTWAHCSHLVVWVPFFAATSIVVVVVDTIVAIAHIILLLLILPQHTPLVGEDCAKSWTILPPVYYISLCHPCLPLPCMHGLHGRTSTIFIWVYDVRPQNIHSIWLCSAQKVSYNSEHYHTVIICFFCSDMEHGCCVPCVKAYLQLFKFYNRNIHFPSIYTRSHNVYYMFLCLFPTCVIYIIIHHQHRISQTL